MPIRTLALLCITLLAACGKPLGTRCTSNPECGGLECLSNAPLLVSNPDSGCSAAGIEISFCSHACTTNADCAGLGKQPVCSTGCFADGLCLDQGTGAAGNPR